jgi:hypothetical protein
MTRKRASNTRQRPDWLDRFPPAGGGLPKRYVKASDFDWPQLIDHVQRLHVMGQQLLALYDPKDRSLTPPGGSMLLDIVKEWGELKDKLEAVGLLHDVVTVLGTAKQSQALRLLRELFRGSDAGQAFPDEALTRRLGVLVQLLSDASGADTKADRKLEKKLSAPESRELMSLIKRVKKNRKPGVHIIDIVREFCEENEKKAQSLYRQLRRYKHLWA